jgi:hypothetical protein
LLCLPVLTQFVVGAAAHLIHGSTVHRFFSLTPELQSKATFETREAPRINEAEVINIDECSMLTAQILEAVDKSLRSIGDKQKVSFAGKSIVLLGDLFQLPAVESKSISSNSQQIYQSQLWPQFTLFELKENCRQADDPVFASLLNRVRVGM